jgi:hypothetical protein
MRFTLPGYWKLSTKGFLEIVPASFIALNTGLSESLSRIQSEMASSRIEIRNGTRQPQTSNVSVVIDVRVSSTTVTASRNPPATDAWIQLVYWPRFPLGACSAT